jgi:hypothetical protein
MRYMMMVKANADYEAGLPPPPELMAAIGRHSQEMAEAGILLETGGLLPSSAGARVRVAGGRTTVLDGPFAETKELVGGFAILAAGSREEAIDLGKRFMQIHSDVLGPAYTGELEIRPMFDGPEGCGAKSS